MDFFEVSNLWGADTVQQEHFTGTSDPLFNKLVDKIRECAAESGCDKCPVSAECLDFWDTKVCGLPIEPNQYSGFLLYLGKLRARKQEGRAK